MDELKRIAECAEVAANAKDQKANESSHTLIQLIADVERLLITSALTREAQHLRRIHRDSVAVLQWAENFQRAVNPAGDPVAALASCQSINATLKERLQKTTPLVNEFNENQLTDPVAAILRSVIKIAGKQRVEGL